MFFLAYFFADWLSKYGNIYYLISKLPLTLFCHIRAGLLFALQLKQDLANVDLFFFFFQLGLRGYPYKVL